MKKLGDDSSARHDPADENQATILVVDDEATIRDLITFMLDALGYKVLSARNAAQALAIANSSEGDCVSLLISDLNLPDMSGIVLAAKLWATRPDWKAVFISGSSKEEFAAMGADLSRSAFVAKPFNLRQITAALHSLTDLQAGLDRAPGMEASRSPEQNSRGVTR